MKPEQPHKGVVPIPEDDFPFALEDCTIPFRRIIRVLARELHSSTLSHPGSRYRDMYRRSEDPRPGDLVVEGSTSYWDDPDTTLVGFGILLAKRLEWETTDEEYAKSTAEQDAEDFAAWIAPRTEEEHARERMTDTAWYVQYGPDRSHVFRWRNASCFALPADLLSYARGNKK